MGILEAERVRRDDPPGSERQDDGVTAWLLTPALYDCAASLGWIGRMDTKLADGVIVETLSGKPHLWTPAEYAQAYGLGWFNGLRVELAQGKVFVKLPASPAHVNCVEDGGDIIRQVFGDGFRVRRESPLPLPSDGVPEPAILVARGSRAEFLARHPRPDEVTLIIEVSDATLHYDRNEKAALYAQAGIEDYWLLNLQNRTLEMRREPVGLPGTPYGFGYMQTTIYTAEQTAAPLALPTAAILVADLLPPAATNA